MGDRGHNKFAIYRVPAGKQSLKFKSTKKNIYKYIFWNVAEGIKIAAETVKSEMAIIQVSARLLKIWQFYVTFLTLMIDHNTRCRILS